MSDGETPDVADGETPDVNEFDCPACGHSCTGYPDQCPECEIPFSW